MGLNALEFAAGSGGIEGMVSAGMHQARIIQIVDLGMQKREYRGEAKPDGQQILITFEIVDEDTEQTTEDGQPIRRWLGTMPIDASLKCKRLQQCLNAVDPDGTKRGNLADLLLAPALLNVEHVTKKNGSGEVYAKIASFNPPMKGMDPPEAVAEPLAFDFDAPDPEVFAKLPEWIQKIIESAVNYQPIANAEDLPF